MTEVYKYRRGGPCKCWAYQIVDGETPVASIKVRDGADIESVCEGLAEVLDHLAAGWPVAGEVTRRRDILAQDNLTDFEREAIAERDALAESRARYPELHKAMAESPALREVWRQVVELSEAGL